MKKKKLSAWSERRCNRPVMPPDGQLLLAPNEVAGLLGCSVQEARRLIYGGMLPSIRVWVNGRRRVHRDTVTDYLRRQAKRYGVKLPEMRTCAANQMILT